LLSRPDEAPLGERDDVLVFTAEPVAHDTDLVGPVRATATVHSDGPAMDVFVRLLDIAPDGTALRIARGQVHVADATTATSVEIDLGQLGYRLHAGHALRVHISASDAPEFIPLPGTGEEPWGAARTTPNTEHLVVGGAEGLRIRVGILEES
jgi:putative CocE/NonD family hydrolase